MLLKGMSIELKRNIMLVSKHTRISLKAHKWAILAFYITDIAIKLLSIRTSDASDDQEKLEEEEIFDTITL